MYIYYLKSCIGGYILKKSVNGKKKIEREYTLTEGGP